MHRFTCTVPTLLNTYVLKYRVRSMKFSETLKFVLLNLKLHPILLTFLFCVCDIRLFKVGSPHEQRIDEEFCYKLGKTFPEAMEIIINVLRRVLEHESWVVVRIQRWSNLHWPSTATRRLHGSNKNWRRKLGLWLRYWNKWSALPVDSRRRSETEKTHKVA